jgi:hypothetical protein
MTASTRNLGMRCASFGLNYEFLNDFDELSATALGLFHGNSVA